MVGVLVGLAGALALTRLLLTLLFGIEPTDPLTFVCVSVLLVSIAGLACFLPARRATRVDPMSCSGNESHRDYKQSPSLRQRF